MLGTQISFNQNWNNKLECSCFTTIRLWNPNKYILGFNYEIFLKDKMLFIARAESVKQMKLAQITNELAMIDTGYNKAEFTKIITTMYKNKNIDVNTADFAVIFLRKVKPF